MTSRALFAWLGVVLGWGGLSCAPAPEAFCQNWVEDTCTAEASCCTGGTRFDPEECRITFSQLCQARTNAVGVHNGAFTFDSSAASDCLGTVSSCATPLSDRAATFDNEKACANMLSGLRPGGATCTSSSDCERAGEFSECYGGVLGVPGAPVPQSICAKVVLDDETCSFSLDTNELHLCSDGKFCDISRFKPSAADAPEVQALVFSAPCRGDIPLGGSCVDPANDSGVFICQTGLFCDVTGGTSATCTKRKSVGASCNSNGGVLKECELGLACMPGGAGQTCQVPPQAVAYCFVPPRCGDGTCDLTESPSSCPQDCGGAGSCGDGVCEAGEVGTCPVDCCGDGQCEPGEAATCPADCGP